MTNLEKLNKYQDWDSFVAEDLKNNPDDIEEYLQVALEEYEADGNIKPLLIAIRHIVDANGGIAKFANKTGLTRQALYKSLSIDGNPRFTTLGSIIRELGFVLSFEIKKAS